MPMYEFRCRHCHQKFERLLPVAHRPDEVHCSHCGEAEPEKLFSAFASTSSGAPEPVSSARSCGTGFG